MRFLWDESTAITTSVYTISVVMLPQMVFKKTHAYPNAFGSLTILIQYAEPTETSVATFAPCRKTSW